MSYSPIPGITLHPFGCTLVRVRAAILSQRKSRAFFYDMPSHGSPALECTPLRFVIPHGRGTAHT